MTHPTETTYRPHARPQPAAQPASMPDIDNAPRYETRWVQYAGPGAHPAGLIPARPEARVRDRAPERSVTATMYSIYVVLLIVAASFGVLAAYQWERRADMLAYAGLMDNRNQVLLARVRDLESANQSLVAAAADAQEEAALAKLRAEASVKDDAADSEVRNFETASGGEPAAPQSDLSSRLAGPLDASQKQSDLSSRLAGPLDASQKQSDLSSRLAGPLDASQTEPQSDLSSRLARPLDASPAKDNDPIIVIQAKEETWIQVQDGGGKPVFTRLMKQGETYTSLAEAGTKLITGNPTGLKVSVNAEPAPAFAEKGPRRREIALDPEKLMTGSAELKKTAK